MECCTVVTGAAGRVGRALRAVWGASVAGMPVVWSARTPGQGIDLAWNIGVEAPPSFAPGTVFLHLAGQTSGSPEALAENRRSAEALCKAAALSQARHVLVMSSIAVYPPSDALLSEAVAPDPISDYGRAKREAEVAALTSAPGLGLTLLRLGNLAGADALLTRARQGPVSLDPIAGQPGGPERSYIGPRTLATVLEALIGQAAAGQTLPGVLNLGQHPPVAMADLLRAAGATWSFGPPRPQAIPRAAMDVSLLASRAALPQASAQSLIADLASLSGSWP